jgi:D-tyrosyl-tRNA(Tyr) deacylase
MRAVIQRVARASVHVYQAVGDATPLRSATIGRGYAILLGVAQGDTEAEADRLVDKIIGLRVFQDAEARMNLDIGQVDGSFLIVSQFTLLADTRKGRRPSFIRAAEPRLGETLYRYAVERVRAAGFRVETGEFGAHMLVEIANDGPVTILLDTAEW